MELVIDKVQEVYNKLVALLKQDTDQSELKDCLVEIGNGGKVYMITEEFDSWKKEEIINLLKIRSQAELSREKMPYVSGYDFVIPALERAEEKTGHRVTEIITNMGTFILRSNRELTELYGALKTAQTSSQMAAIGVNLEEELTEENLVSCLVENHQVTKIF